MLEIDFDSAEADENDELWESINDIESAWKIWAQYSYRKGLNRGKADADAADKDFRRIPSEVVHITVDKKENVIVNLEPRGIIGAFGEKIKTKMEEHTRRIYGSLKDPRRVKDKRHVSEQLSKGGHTLQTSQLDSKHTGQGDQEGEASSREEQLDRASSSQQKPKPEKTNYTKASDDNARPTGLDHYRHWHEQGHDHDLLANITETSDSCNKLGSVTQRQLLLEYLKNTGGTMTRALEFWFGTSDRNLREE